MVDLTLSLAPGTYGAENREGPGVTVSKRQDLYILHLAGDLSDTDFPTAARHALGFPYPNWLEKPAMGMACASSGWRLTAGLWSAAISWKWERLARKPRLTT